MIGIPVVDQLGTAGIALGQFERPFDGLAARIDEVDRVERIGQQRSDPLGIAHLRRLDRLAVDHQMKVIARLSADRVNHPAVAVPDGADRHAGDQIDPPPSVRAVQVHALGALHFEHHRVVGSLAHMFQKELSEIGRHSTVRFLRLQR